ncbi:MAG: UDP-N-acetylmuramate--L-alanine ligase [Pseudomonadota bacterium]|nr:UDP-N-acetylmuramate--L-alanine ligase [Pseudomonadota bacterium]
MSVPPHVPARIAQQAWMRRIRRIHFVGIGGAGMSGIAEVLHNLGYAVSGSDARAGGAVERLRELGVPVHLGHAPAHIAAADVVVISTAVAEDNPEVVAAHAAGVPVVRRAEMLGELMRFRYGIAVAGTHGKTTTTSLIASVLAEGALDPTFVIGGRLNSAGSNARLGTGSYLVAEADESDGSFLRLQPMIAVVTNIDADHMATYGGDLATLRNAFLTFLHNLPFYGLAVVCLDDPALAQLLPQIGRPVMTYGFAEQARVRASELVADGPRTRFTLTLPDGSRESVTLNLPGRHNVLNALAAAGVAYELGVSTAQIAAALARFEGIGRRFHQHPPLPVEGGEALLVDDYAHHPTELAAAMQAVRAAWPERRLVLVFQPHRYSRTRDLLDDFARVLSTADALLLCEVYAAGETPLPAADGRALARAVRQRGQVEPVFVPVLDELAPALAAMARAGDVVLTAGAGDIGAAVGQLGGRWPERS